MAQPSTVWNRRPPPAHIVTQTKKMPLLAIEAHPENETFLFICCGGIKEFSANEIGARGGT